MFNNTTDALNWRYATKKFDANKKISDADWGKIEDAFVLSPSSYGLQPWKFMVVTNKKVREELKSVSWNQSQVTDCSHYVVLLGRKDIDKDYVNKWIETIARVRKIDANILGGYKQMMIDKVAGKTSTHIPNFGIEAWCYAQTYIALGTAMTVAAILKIDTCAIEGIDSLKEYGRILNAPKEYGVLCGCAFGYRAGDDSYADMKKARFDKDEVVLHID